MRKRAVPKFVLGSHPSLALPVEGEGTKPINAGYFGQRFSRFCRPSIVSMTGREG